MFDYIVCMMVDKKINRTDYIKNQTKFIGCEYHNFIVGDGLNKDIKYDYVDKNKPTEWTGNNQTYNYTMSFFNIIRKYKNLKAKSILFLEDDVVFLPHFESFLNIIMDNVIEYDMIYFTKDENEDLYKIQKPFLFLCDLHFNMQAVAISSSMFEPILELEHMWWLPENPTFDVTIGYQFHQGRSEKYGKRKCYASFPYLVIEGTNINNTHKNTKLLEEYNLWSKIV